MVEGNKHTVSYNVVMNAIVMASSFVFPLITVPYVSRVLLEYGNGIVAFSQSFVYYFSIIASMGVANYGVVACSKHKGEREKLSITVYEIACVLAVASLFVTVVYIAVVAVGSTFDAERLLFFAMSASIWTTSFSFEWLYQALEQYDYITLRTLVVRTLGTIAIFPLVTSADDYLIYALITVATQGSACVINLVHARTYLERTKLSSIHPTKHVKPMITYLVANMSSGMCAKSDTLILGFLGSVEAVGIYQLAAKVKTMVVAATNSVSSVLLPRLTSYSTHGEEERYLRLLAYGIDFSLIVGLGAVFCIVLCARPIILILGGEQFIGSIAPLVALTPAILFSTIASVITQTLLITGKEAQFAMANVVSLLVAVLGNIVLIPRLGIIGPAIAISISQLVMLVIAAYKAKESLLVIKGRVDAVKIVAAVVLAVVVSACVSHLLSDFNVIVQLLCVGSVFASSYLFVLLLIREDLTIAVFARFLKKGKRKDG